MFVLERTDQSIADQASSAVQSRMHTNKAATNFPKAQSNVQLHMRSENLFKKLKLYHPLTHYAYTSRQLIGYPQQLIR